MQVKHYKSLRWLSRWHNGQALRLWQQLQHHHGILTELVLAELGNRPVTSPLELTLGGMHILCEVEGGEVKLYSISPPETGTGIQRNLFTLENLPRQRESTVQLTGKGRRLLRVLPAPASPTTRRGA
jgi:hypothetical protein